MVMFSQHDYEILQSKMQKLETELRKIKDQQKCKDIGCKKLTFKLTPETVHLNYYSITNFTKILPENREK